MMTNAHSQDLPATKIASAYPKLSASLIDRATAMELRRTTRNAAYDRRAPDSRVPVVIVPPSPESATTRSNKLRWSQIKHGLSWMAAAIVALSVPLAMAIPLELLRQHG